VGRQVRPLANPQGIARGGSAAMLWEFDAGRLIREIVRKDSNVVYLGSAILWNVTKVTIT
jgi:hypothetical protein